MSDKLEMQSEEDSEVSILSQSSDASTETIYLSSDDAIREAEMADKDESKMWKALLIYN